MKIIDIGEKDGTCIICHVELSPDEKRSRVPICIKCMSDLADTIKGGIDINSIDIDSALEEFSNDVSNFTDFVSSSASLMKLDDVVVVQVCFNIYMDTVRDIIDRNPNMARKIFSDARRFIDIELERLEDSGEDDGSKNGDWGKRDIIEKMMGDMSKMMKDFHGAQSRNDDVSGGDDNVNDGKVGHMPDKDKDKNEIKKEIETGVKVKRIRVD
jgi:hypothetical protein